MSQRFAAILFGLGLLFMFSSVRAQRRSATDTIMLGGVVINGDTMPMVYLSDVYKLDKSDPRYAAERQRLDQLRYNVYKVYPYAMIAAGILKDVDATLDRLPDRRARKTYLKSVEKELDSRFKGELKDLTITQGQILVKLIDRQTGQNCYHIIKEMKGGINAFIWQSVALVFSNNLRREYDPSDRDKDIEHMVRELEAANNHYYYQVQQANTRAAASH
ncbi:MAG: DUF4294 domain-containing protein [Taibaiella sp.]|nr:DUF4294 domain-containing protein [Taibaiella sp.]